MMCYEVRRRSAKGSIPPFLCPYTVWPVVKMGFGDYHVDYNPKVHGPYDPARFYGKADTPLAQVKLGEVSSWLARRSVSGIPSAASRAFWRWQHKYVLPKKTGIAPFAQLAIGSMIFFYAINYGKLASHRNHKYHW
ncbi:hypothetical protein Pcinc_031362 [Petrolisthes cinctipes]|uniref:Mitochondrial ATP synthase F chain n=1 Tax=Petrolisthes cinctipes TaxID=88211 RepID=A0AAE1EWT8_PETCI|nr:hypothetical protein Pcinc_031362 [Petrolisthes cinctipes]